MFNQPKHRLRLPSDTGPNPYDSKTPLKDLTPRHLTWGFWFQIGLLALGFTLCKIWFGGGLVG